MGRRIQVDYPQDDYSCVARVALSTEMVSETDSADPGRGAEDASPWWSLGRPPIVERTHNSRRRDDHYLPGPSHGIAGSDDGA